MAQNSLLNEEVVAGAELARQFNDYMPVKAAFWLKIHEDAQRYLYISTQGVDEGKLDLAYGEVLRLGQKMGSIFLDPFHVKLIGTQDPLAKAAQAMHDRFAGDNLGTRMGGHMFGGSFIDEGYLYPTNLEAAGR